VLTKVSRRAWARVRGRKGLRQALACIGVFIGYVAGARFGLSLDPLEGFATLVWPPTGIALGCLIRFGPWLWPGVAAGALVANRWSGAPWSVAAGIALGNTLEAILGARLLRCTRGGKKPIRRLRHAAALLAAALASPVVSASVGVLCLWLAGITPLNRELATWKAWWLGDVLGALVVAPVVMNWDPRFFLGWSRARWLEAAFLSAAVVASAALSFSGGLTTPLQQPHMIFPVLIWAALRFGPPAAAGSVLAAAAIAVAFTADGRGPYAVGPLHERLTALQGFMGNAAITSLFLAAGSAERERALASLRRKRRALEQALGARDEFLSIASHELRTPLAALSLQVSGLQRVLSRREAGGQASGSDLERVGRAVRQVERLARLVDQLLDVSQIAAGRLSLQRESVDLSELVRSVIHTLSEEAARVGCAVNLLAPAHVLGSWDSFRLEQVLTNLLTNAFKYGAGKPIEVRLEADDTRALLQVRDGGIGIAPDALQRIFERFERVTTRGQHRSLGIGLYIARQVVEAHAGKIDVQSTPGEGSCFRVELPLAMPAGAQEVSNRS
jgi:signal transduction histidine kinase